MELFCLRSACAAAAACLRRVPPFLGIMVLRTRPKRSLFIFHLLFTPTFSLALSLFLDLFALFSSLFFLFFSLLDIFNVSEAVRFRVNWLKLAAQRLGQKRRAPAPGRERNHSHVKLREGFQLLRCKEFKRHCLVALLCGVNSARPASHV